MICAFCKSGIDDDSLYCDQCGKEVLVCPKCHKPGKGKMCTFDGIPLVSKKNETTPGLAGTEVSEAVTPSVSKPVAQVAGICELRLINKNLGLDLKIEDGDIVGRTKGRFVNIFSKYSTVSGQHAQFKLDSNNKCWTIIDLDSTNGTKYNNITLKPMQSQVLTDKSYLCIANIEFYVQISNGKVMGKTGTLRI